MVVGMWISGWFLGGASFAGVFFFYPLRAENTPNPDLYLVFFYWNGIFILWDTCVDTCCLCYRASLFFFLLVGYVRPLFQWWAQNSHGCHDLFFDSSASEHMIWWISTVVISHIVQKGIKGCLTACWQKQCPFCLPLHWLYIVF